MTTAKQLEQTLKDKYLGKEYTDFNAGTDCRMAVCNIVQDILGENSGYIVINRQNHSLNKIVIRDTRNGIEADLVSIVVKKKKGETHRYRFGGSSTDYTYANFIVTMNEPDIETALQNAIDDIKRQLDSRNDKLAKLKADIETVKKALGFANDWDVKYWAESVKSNWYKLDL